MFTLLIEFHDDVPFPEVNWLVYRRVYVLEQWLRRIAYTAVMAKAGSSFLGALPDGLAPELKKRQALLRGRKHLGTENTEDALWLANLEELRRLLIDDGFYPIVKGLTGYERALLDSRLDEVRAIRNIVGHNRAVSSQTLTILDVHLLALVHGLDEFKRQMFTYSKDAIWALDEAEGSAISAMFHGRLGDRELI